MMASAFAAFFCTSPRSRGQTSSTQALRDPASPNPATRDSRVCASCHPGVWATYRRTGMAQSFYRPAPDRTVEDYAHKNTFYHQASDTHFEMIHVPANHGPGGPRDRYFQRQSTIDFDGRQTNVVEHEIDFVLGSGNHARTYLHRTANGTLSELPLGWYAENGGAWAMNPGYDRPDHQGVERKITYDCMFCHNGYPEIPPGDTGPRSAPIFSSVPEGIDCQRCHGDGEKHIALARGPGVPGQGARLEEIRAAIVNPSRLTPERQMEVCMQCHLETTSSLLPASIVRYERGPFSYQPGEPLADFMLHFDHAPGTKRDEKFEITGSVYGLRQSECFRKSNGALTCTTCHNPHDAVRGEEATRHYTSVCRQCHGAAVDSLVKAGAHTASTDCAGCHMPKRRTDDVVHAVMTDHLIQRRKPERDLLAPLAEPKVEANAYRGEVMAYYPLSSARRPQDEVYLAIAQVNQQSNLTAGIARLQAALEKYHPQRAEYYLQLGDALCNAGRFAEAVPAYEGALRLEPKSAAALERLALCLSSLKQYSRAESTLNQALDLAPNAATWIQLGVVRLQEGKTLAASSAFEKAIALDPEMPDAYNTAGAIWFEIGDPARAETELRHAIRLQPNSAPAHDNLGNLLSASDRFEEARFHFEAALRFKDNYNGARYNYAIALAKVHRLDDARTQVEAILRTDPNSAGAHEFLGNLLGAQGRRDQAIEQYREAVRIQPDFARANLDLGAALADSGEVAAALKFLRKAAQSTDASAREEALKLLDKLGKVP
jgi:predicted CXXCH cytochrome family protein